MQLTEHFLLLITGSSAVWSTGEGSILSALSPSLGLQPLTASAERRETSVVFIRDEESSSSCQEGEQGDYVILNTADSASFSTINPLFFTVPHSFDQLTLLP